MPPSSAFKHQAARRRRAKSPPAPRASKARLLGSGTALHSWMPVLAEVRPVGAVVNASSKINRWICTDAPLEPKEEDAEAVASNHPVVTRPPFTRASMNLN